MTGEAAMDIQGLVIEILAEQALRDPAGIDPAARLADLGLDSLGVVETIFALEERFDISVPFNANEPGKSGFDLSTVSSVVAAVERLLHQKAA